MQPWIAVDDDLRITGSGAAWIPSARTLVVADVHVGYELAARRRGGFLPSIESGAAIGTRLASMALAVDADRLVIAGDLRHSTRDVDALERAELSALAAAVRAEVALDVVLGNHDRGDALVGGTSHASLRVGDVDVVHHPPREAPARWTVCGHLHPRITLRDETGASARYDCALVGPRTVVLPAFSDWAGGAEVRKLIPDLFPGRWRALPISGGLIAELETAVD